MIALLRAVDADVVGIQELSRAQAKVLGRDIGDLYPYQELRQVDFPGMGLLSRHPILEREDLLPEFNVIRGTLDVDGVAVTAIVAHPPRLGFTLGGVQAHPRAAETFAKLASIAIEGAPSVLIGDLNTTDQSDGYQILVRSDLTDAFRSVGSGLGLTYPAAPVKGVLPLPLLMRIDFVLHTSDFKPLRAWVGSSFGSDHLPVIAELAWGKDEP